MKTERKSLHIEQGNYEGYLWFSDSKNPIIIPDKESKYDLKNKGLDISYDQNPFVIEGMLYDEKTGKSCSIKYVDGGYLVKEYQIEDQVPTNVHKLTFQSHRMDGRKLKFLQYWEEDEDILCDDPQNEKGMKTLRPGKLVFLGFDNN